MKKTFLEKLSTHLLEKYPGKLGELCIVFPNKRAALFFKKSLAKLINKPLWAPAIYSVDEFIKIISGVEIPDNTSLLFSLYDIHKQIKGAEAGSFDDFCKWAVILINDLNEIDNYLADGEKLFSNLNNLKVVDNWSLGEEELTDFQKQYLSFWESLGVYYKQFKEKLISENTAYKGLAYRMAADAIESVDLAWEQVVFAGFNAPSLSEEKIIKALIKKQRAEIIWDSDTYYLNNEIQEAGKFLRKHIKDIVFAPGTDHSRSFFIKEELLNNDAKNITVIGASGRILEAKIAGDIINDLVKEKKTDINTIAVVLPDENLLFPVLNSLPS